MRREAKAVKGLRGVNLEDPYDAYGQTTCRQMQGAYRPNILRAQTAQLVENNDKTPEMVTQRSIFLTTRQNNWNEKYPTPQRGGRPAVGLLRVCAWWWVFLLRSSNALCKSWLGRKLRCGMWGILLSYAPESGARGVSTWRIIMSEGRRIASFFFWGRTKPEKKWIEVAHCAPPLSLLELVVSAVGLLTA